MISNAYSWDLFVDRCWEKGIDPADADFGEFLEEMNNNAYNDEVE